MIDLIITAVVAFLAGAIFQNRRNKRQIESRIEKIDLEFYGSVPPRGVSPLPPDAVKPPPPAPPEKKT